MSHSAPVSNDECAESTSLETERSGELDRMIAVAQQELFMRLDAPRNGRRRREPRAKPLDLDERSRLLRAPFAVEDADRQPRVLAPFALRPLPPAFDKRGGAERCVRAFVCCARDAADDLRRAERVQQATTEVCDERKLAVAPFEGALALRGFEARGERLDLVLLAVVRREDDDGKPPRRRLRAQQAAKRQPAHARKLYVQNHEIAARLSVQFAQGLRRVAAADDPVPFGLERAFESAAHALVILDNEDRRGSV